MRSKASSDAVLIIHQDGCTIYRYPDGTEYKIRNLIRDTSIPINAEAATYMERIAPQLKPLDEALKERGISKSEWYRQREEAAMSALYGCPVKTII